MGLLHPPSALACCAPRAAGGTGAAYRLLHAGQARERPRIGTSIGTTGGLVLCGLGEYLVRRAVATLISERPRNHACPVLVAPHHPAQPRQKGAPPRRQLGERALVAVGCVEEAVRLDVRLVDHVQPERVAQLVPRGLVRARAQEPYEGEQRVRASGMAAEGQVAGGRRTAFG